VVVGSTGFFSGMMDSKFPIKIFHHMDEFTVLFEKIFVKKERIGL
jgi:hypothetical protein